MSVSVILSSASDGASSGVAIISNKVSSTWKELTSCYRTSQSSWSNSLEFFSKRVEQRETSRKVISCWSELLYLTPHVRKHYFSTAKSFTSNRTGLPRPSLLKQRSKLRKIIQRTQKVHLRSTPTTMLALAMRKLRTWRKLCSTTSSV